ncbi:nucleoporin-like protein [Parasponia andersonii]|uniref:Nucleoporin-like protein n=1 Tax=Parasponia andersonii TaxID=3476 RepID=A0A2P5CQ98_PARAD|nr:nucleoporin-like protein [Parasponia andersonii]
MLCFGWNEWEFWNLGLFVGFGRKKRKMETNGETASLGAQYGEERGAGGKLRKPTRKPPATPYARPAAPSQADGAQQRRWLSKLVDPACRLISGGASLFFPSFFSKSPLAINPDTEDHIHDNQVSETGVQEDDNGDDQNCIKNHEMSRTTGVVGPSTAADVSESISDLVRHKQDKRSDAADDDGLSEIECLLKGKKFSRQVMVIDFSDEVNRLMQIINSRAAELPNVEQEKKYQIIAAEGETKGAVASHGIINTPSDRNQRDLHGSVWKTSTPLPRSMPDEVGASPIDIAKAYMGSRTLETGSSSKGMTLKDERSLFYGAEFASKPFIPSPSPKPSACWPGAMLQDEGDLLTPKSQIGRFGLHNFPRTPYSRTIFSKSKSKLMHAQGDNDKWMRPPTSLPTFETPIYGEEKSRSIELEGNHGSVGPIRRSRHKLGTQTPFRGSRFIESSSVGPSKVENSNISQGFLPAFKKNFEPGGTSSGSRFQSVDRKKNQSFEVGVPAVHPQSSQIARTILEHIDRNPPTPKDKSEELKLTFAWKNSISSSVPSVDRNGQKSQNSLLNVKGFDSHKILNQDSQNKPAQENSDKGNSLFTVSRQENTVKVVDNVGNPRSDVFFSNGGGVSQIRNSHEGTTIAPSQALNLKKMPAASGTKPVLSNISIDKPNSKWAFSSDQSSGFTFPVSTTSEVLSEPPTPSIMPSFSASSQQQPKDGSAVPSYTFGSMNPMPSLAFSFPSTSSASIQNDTSDIKFSFGSDEPRLSFGSIKKDAICY